MNMKRIPLVLFFFGLCSLLYGASLDVKKVDAIASEFIDRNDVTGLSIGLYFNDKSHYYNYGYLSQESSQEVSNETLFEIGSVTKVFTALLLAQAANKKKISLSQTIDAFLPEGLNDENIPIDRLTFLQLATHTSSLPRIPGNASPLEPYPLKTMITFLKQWKAKYKPGTRYLYSNLGYGVLGYTLEGVYDKSYQSLLTSQILTPLSMTSTFLSVPPWRQSDYAKGYNKANEKVIHWPMNAWRASAGGIRSTIVDMMQFLKAHLLVKTMSIPFRKAILISQKSEFTRIDGTQVGLGWEISFDANGDKILTKNGATNGFSSIIIFKPKQRVGVIILTNKFGARVKRIATALLARL
jgi:beta-lactamase class C